MVILALRHHKKWCSEIDNKECNQIVILAIFSTYDDPTFRKSGSHYVVGSCSSIKIMQTSPNISTSMRGLPY